MAENDIPEMRSYLDAIRRTDDNGNEYWNSRDLSNAMGYSAYWRFQHVIDKSIAAANAKGLKFQPNGRDGQTWQQFVPQSERLPPFAYGMYDNCRKCRQPKNVRNTSKRVFQQNRLDNRADTKLAKFQHITI